MQAWFFWHQSFGVSDRKPTKLWSLVDSTASSSFMHLHSWQCSACLCAVWGKCLLFFFFLSELLCFLGSSCTNLVPCHLGFSASLPGALAKAEGDACAPDPVCSCMSLLDKQLAMEWPQNVPLVWQHRAYIATCPSAVPWNMLFVLTL